MDTFQLAKAMGAMVFQTAQPHYPCTGTRLHEVNPSFLARERAMGIPEFNPRRCRRKSDEEEAEEYVQPKRYQYSSNRSVSIPAWVQEAQSNPRYLFPDASNPALLEQLIISRLNNDDTYSLRRTCRAGRDAVARSARFIRLQEEACTCYLKHRPIDLHVIVEHGFSNVKELDFSLFCTTVMDHFLPFTKAYMKTLVQAKWPELEKIRLYYKGSDGEAVMRTLATADWPALKSLRLGPSFKSSKALSSMYPSDEVTLFKSFAEKKPFPKLQYLFCEGMALNQADLRHISETGWELFAINISYIKYSNTTITSLSSLMQSMPSIKRLELFNEKEKAFLGGSLDLLLLESLPAMPTVKELEFTFVKFPKEFSCFKSVNAPSVEKLELHEVKNTGAALLPSLVAGLGRLVGLRHLSLSGSELAGPLISLMKNKNFDSLQELNVKDCKLTNTHLKALLQSAWTAQLTALLIGHNKFGSKGAALLVEFSSTSLKNLETLDVAACGFMKSDYKTLSKGRFAALKRVVAIPCSPAEVYGWAHDDLLDNGMPIHYMLGDYKETEEKDPGVIEAQLKSASWYHRGIVIKEKKKAGTEGFWE